MAEIIQVLAEPVDWGYALALYAYLRKEKKSSQFLYLSESVQFDFNDAALIIGHHPEMIMPSQIKLLTKNHNYK